MTGGYLALQIGGYIIGPIIAFRNHVFPEMLPAFGDLDKRAEQMAEEYYNRIGSQPAYGHENFDMADVAEAAQDHSISWYQMMTSLRQSMLNLLAAGLFHLTEQQLAMVCRDGGFTMDPPRYTKLEDVTKWYAKHLRLDLETLPSWPIVNEMRMVANTVKHAEIGSTKQLRELRPELFSNPDFEEIYKEFEQHGMGRTMGPVRAPLSGEEFFVSEKLLQVYAEATESFFREIAEHFKAHHDATDYIAFNC